LHIRNLLYNWGAAAANLIVAFFLAPFVVDKLGIAAYGVWTLLNVVAGYMGILDLGVASSTGRHVCLYLGKKQYKEVDDTIRTGLAFFLTLGGFIFLLGIAVGTNFTSLFPSVPDNLVSVAKWLTPLMAINIIISASGAIFRSVLTAHNRFDITSSVDILVLSLRTAGTVWLLSKGTGLIGLASVVVLSNLIALLLVCGAAKYIYRALPLLSFKFSKVRLREMMNYGLAAFLCTITVQVVGQTDLLMAEWLVNIEAVTIYSIGAALVWYAAPFINMINATLFPSIQQAVGAGKKGEALWLMYRQARITLMVAIPMNVGFAIFSKPFLNLWMGEKIGIDGVQTAALVMSILAVNKLQISMTSSYPNILSSLGKIWKITYVNVAESFMNIILSLLLAWGLGYGLLGIALGTLISRAMTVTLVAPFLLKSEAGVDLIEQIREIFIPGIMTICIFAVICFTINMSVVPTSWITFSTAVVVAMASYGVIAWIILLPVDIKNKLINRLSLSS